jgi:hypothetical protein
MASITIESPRDVKKVIESVEAYIVEQERDLAIWQKVMEALKVFDGKIISKRMETAVKKVFPRYTLYLENESLVIIHIWGDDVGYNKRIAIYLRHDEKVYNHAKTLENSGYFNFIQIKNQGLRASLMNDARVIKELVGDFNNCVKRLQAINEEAERYGYPLSSILDMKS